MSSWGGYWRYAQVAASASPLLSVATLIAVAGTSVAPLGAVAAIGAVVGRIPDVLTDGLGSSAGRSALWWALAAGGFFLLQSAMGALRTAAATALGERVDARLQRELMAAVMGPDGVAHLEDPRTVDLVNVGRDTFRAAFQRPGRLAGMWSSLASSRIILLGACLIVARFHPLLGLTLLAAGLWAAYEHKAASRVEASHHNRGTEIARRTEYYYELGVTPPAAKEVRVFGLSTFLLDRFAQSWNRSMEAVLVPAGLRSLAATAALGAVVVAGIAWIAREALGGRLGVAQATVYAQSLMVSLEGIRQAAAAGVSTELALATLHRFDEACAAARRAAGAAPGGAEPVDAPRQSIRFEGVSFSYPSGTTDALHHLDLEIPAGRSLAIVGANGAGKTTLVKLLCGLYSAAEGRITVDGVDLATLDPASWRRQLAPVFQDSVRFELPAHANVGFGRVDAAADRSGVEAAASAAGVAKVISALPRGWETPLSVEHTGGADLSGGEWQKVGLARALFAVRHGASVLILDEPAAHLDARAEAELYERFLAMTEGITTIVISHRFSTVRQAESIVVLDDGGVVEQGTHDELLAADGAYAAMFRLQASRFADADAASDPPADGAEVEADV